MQEEWIMKRFSVWKITIFLLCFLCFVYLGLVVLFQPSHTRDWELGQERLPHILFEEHGVLVIENFRDFAWFENGDVAATYETRMFHEDQLDSVDVFISHFDEFEGLAHIFLSFGFETGEHIVVSLETRREVGEEFSPLLGILRQFEIIYVVGSEEDIVGVRTGIRNERVYLYPTKASKEQSQELFRLLAKDINDVYEKPRMYNTLTHNCTNELTRRVEDMSDIRFPFTWKSILPGYFDEVLYAEGLIDRTESFEVIKERNKIDNTTVHFQHKNFQEEIRQHIF